MSDDNNIKEIELKSDFEKTPESTKSDVFKSTFIIDNIEEFENKKEIKTETLILNEFWVHLIAKLLINLNIFYCELIPIILYDIIEDFRNLSYVLVSAYKYIFFIQFVPQFSIILYSLTTFSKVLKKTKKIKKFYIINIVKALIFYFISFLILFLIKNNLFDYLNDKFKEKNAENVVFEVLDDFIDFLLKFIGNLLAIFNTYLDNLIVGSLYIFLFKNPKKLRGKKLFNFRLMSIFPIYSF